MLADFFTKPLQGTLFYKFRAMLMNLDQDVIPDTPDLGSVLESEESEKNVNTDDGHTVRYQLPVNKQKNAQRAHSSA